MVGVGLGLGVLALAIVGYGRYGADVWRWGCPSEEELRRPRGVGEVAEAFARAGLPLERVGWPPELRRARAYEGAAVLRHESPRVRLTVLVCPERCELGRFQLRPGGPRERVRFGFSLGSNVAGWIQGADRQADADLRAPLGRALSRIDGAVDPGSRCYVG